MATYYNNASGTALRINGDLTVTDDLVVTDTIRSGDGTTTAPAIGEATGLAGLSFGSSGAVTYFLANGAYQARCGPGYFEISQNRALVTTGPRRDEGVLTPAQITSNQTDYAPTGAENYYRLRLSSDASRNIYSFNVNVTDGQEYEFINVGAQNIVLVTDDGTNGTATRRFKFPASATIPADGVATIRYDGTTARWRLKSKNF